MKKLGTILLGAICTSGIAQENGYQHIVSPKVFYKNHEEEGYNYKTISLGLEYYAYSPKGFNLKLAVSSDVEKKFFLETEKSIFFRIPLSDNLNLFPIVRNETLAHEWERTLTVKKMIHKNKNSFGIGWEWQPTDLPIFDIETSLFQDSYSAVIFAGENKFSGEFFPNLWGMTLKGGVHFPFHQTFHSKFGGFFSRALNKSYTQWGYEGAVSVNF